MGDYTKSKGKSRGRFTGRDDRDGDRPIMHKAVCSDCGSNCEVPFRPTGERPIYCSDCFQNKSDSPRGDRDKNNRRGGSGRDYQRRDFRSRYEDQRQNQFAKAPSTENLGHHLEKINQTLNKILQVLSLATNEDAQMNESETGETKKATTKKATKRKKATQKSTSKKK